jgi:multidrug efflux system outer membrane protein
MRRRLFVAVVLLAAILPSGCLVGPNYHRPPVSVPDNFRAAAPDIPATVASFGEQKWWDVFQDPELQTLIRTALQSNYDLRIAAERILEAQSQLSLTKANQYPEAAGILAGNNNRNNQSKFFSAYETGTTQLAVGFQWNLDFWGKYRRASEAARDQLLADEWARKEVVDSLVSGLASAYFTMRDLDLQLQVSQKTLASDKDSLQLTQLLVDHGATSLLDVRQAEQLVYAAAASVPSLEKQIEQQENLIQTLMGGNPAAVPRGLELTAQPHMPEVPAGLPSALLERRPDIRAAEAHLMSMNAEIGVARASYFPSIALTGVGGLESTGLSRLFSGPSGMWTFASNLTQPLFAAGALKSTVRLARQQQEEAVLTYQQTIQHAFQEVSDALIGYSKDQDFRKQQELLTHSAEDASRLSDIRYRGGAASYLEVLDSNTRYYSAQLTLAQAQLRELLDYVALYQALGGGFAPEVP